MRTWGKDHNGPATAGSTRRSVLRTGIAALTVAAVTPALVGCDLLDPPPPPPPDPLTGFLAQTRAMVSRYDAALAAVPSLNARLGQVREAHQAHAEALIVIMTPRPSAAANGPATTPPSGGTSPAGDTRTILAGLRTAEQAAQKSAIAACVAAPSARATLLGEIAAARASHLEVLR